MTGKLMFVPDTHVVVHKKLEPVTYYYTASPLREKLIEYIDKAARHEPFLYDEMWDDLIKAPPPLTTPPVLRWEGAYLKVGNVAFASIEDVGGWEWTSFSEYGDNDGKGFSSADEARRAAEKALGLPIVEEV